MYQTKYRIVDSEGYEIDYANIRPEKELPVKIKSVRLDADFDLVMTLEYLHGA